MSGDETGLSDNNGFEPRAIRFNFLFSPILEFQS